MMEIYQISPWYNTEEWNQVYNEIFGVKSTLTTKQNALEQLFVWKARCPSLPSAIEATMSLLNVHIQDQNQSKEICNDHVIRLAYSSALMRFVNHMFDNETAKGLSLFQAANIFGVPEWIIELRHDTAHSNKLSNIELLREASILSLEWLQKNYWEKHKLCISDFVVGRVHNETKVEKNIMALMNFCMSLSICSHHKCNVKNLADISDDNLKECLINDAQELCDKLDFSNLKVIPMAGLWNIINKKAKKILAYEGSSSYVSKILLSNDYVFLSLEMYRYLDNIGYSTDKALSREYVQCFDGLLSFLLTHGLLRDFVLELIKITQNEHENSAKRCKLAAKWISVILRALRKNQQFMEKINKTNIDITSKNEKELKSLYYHWYPNEMKRTLLLDLHKPIPKEFTNINFMQPIISTYNSYLAFFIKDILNLIRPELPDPVMKKICQLAKVVAFPEKFPFISPKIFTSEDIEPENNLDTGNDPKQYDDVDVAEVETAAKKNNEDGTKQKFGIWQLASENVAWASCPIGQLPWTQSIVEPMDIQ